MMYSGLIESVLRTISTGARGLVINNHIQNARQIRTQVDALAPAVSFVSYQEMKSRLEGSPQDTKPFCLFTFDDGKEINATETAPELLRLGIPAVFFLVTAWTGTERALWFDRFSALERAGATGSLPGLTAMKSLPWREREQLIDQQCAATGVDAEAKDPLVRLMTWQQARGVQQQGFEFGSHTAHHAILTSESPEEARREIAASIEEFKHHDMGPCRTLAFPNGNTRRDLVEMALQEGFESTMTTVPVWVGRRDSLASVPRLYIKENADKTHIQIKAVAARTGVVLKNPNGEARRYLRTRL